MLYTIRSGSVSDEHYGLTLAKAVGLPAKFIQKADEVSKRLRQQRDERKQVSEARKLIRRRKLVLNLQEQLKHAEAADMDSPRLAEYLSQLQEEFVMRMAAIEEGKVLDPIKLEDGGTESVVVDSAYDDEDMEDESLWDEMGLT